MAEEKNKRVRRGRKAVLEDKITLYDRKINQLKERIALLEADRDKFKQQIEEIGNEALKKERAEEQKKITALIKKKGITLEELEALLAGKE